MHWQLIIKEFGPNTQHISGVDNIVNDTLSRLPSISVYEYDISTSKAQCFTNELFAIIRAEKNEDCFPLNLLNVQREQQK